MTAGAGHRRAAEAVAQAARAAFPDARVECRDLLEETHGWVKRSYPAIYYFLVCRLGPLWGMAFSLFDRRGVYTVVQPLRRVLNRLTARRFIERLRADPPDLIVATHFFPADLISVCKAEGWCRVPLIVVVTDLHPHRFWIAPQPEAYVCSSTEGAALLAARGVPRERIHALGIPISARFRETFDQGEVLQRFGLVPGRDVVLVTSGGTTVGPFEAVVKALAELETGFPGRAQLLVVCGANARVAGRLSAWARHAAMPVRVFGFIESMPEAMAVASLVVAKAGGLTVTEALGCGRPLVIYHAIPGQEQVNAAHVARHGAAVIATRPPEVAQAARRFFEDAHLRQTMLQAAATLGDPRAADAIVTQVIRPLLARSRP